MSYVLKKNKQKTMPGLTTGDMDTFLDVTMVTNEHITDYTRYYFDGLSKTTRMVHEYNSEYAKLEFSP